MVEDKFSLEKLPDDLLLDIISQLDTAQDVANIASSCRRTTKLAHQDSWRTFVRRSFPSLSIPTEGQTRWNAVADHLTYVDRCWDKRAVSLTLFKEQPPGRRNNRRQQPRQQTVRFHSIVDALLLPDSRDELLAWGAGEDIFVQKKTRRNGGQDGWGQLRGAETGYAAGTGDVTALSLLDRQGSLEMIVGRADGDLQLLSAAEESFGQTVQHLVSPTEDNVLSSMQRSPGQTAITWTEWSPQSRLLASCKRSAVTLYSLDEDDSASLQPVAYCDVSSGSAADEACLVRSAKFLSKDVMACALGGSREPLRWGKIFPTGVQFLSPSSTSSSNEDVTRVDNITTRLTTIRAIEPVGSHVGESLLLCAWDDGTYRLTDIRTPADHDAVYRDQFQPYQSSSSLLVYGNERFIAGSNWQPDLRFFDFRYPKSYHHTTAYACSAESPFPKHAYGSDADSSSDLPQISSLGLKSQRCDSQRGSYCPWHQQSKTDSWRPDATLHLGVPEFDSICSLAKASDMSDTFYCGVRGGVAEATMSLAEHWGGQRAGRVPQRTPPPGWRVWQEGGEARLIETGIGLCGSDQRPGETSKILPRMLYHHNPWRLAEVNTGSASPRSRLDSAWRTRVGELPL